jgi:hypothetical protein
MQASGRKESANALLRLPAGPEFPAPSWPTRTYFDAITTIRSGMFADLIIVRSRLDPVTRRGHGRVRRPTPTQGGQERVAPYWQGLQATVHSS